MSWLAVEFILVICFLGVVAAVQEWRKAHARPLCEECGHAVVATVHGPYGCSAIVMATRRTPRLCGCCRHLA